jgi:hypothetical protein
MLNSDCGKLIIYNRATAIAVTLPQAGGGGDFADGCTIWTKNINAGDVTITPTTSTISGAASIVVSLGEGGIINSDGTNYEAVATRSTAGSNITLTKSRTGVAISTTAGGDVVGPASAVNNNLMASDGTTGKLLKDSGLPSSSTGTGDIVRATSPTLVTPALGTPSALVLTNATGLPLAGGGTGGTTAPTARSGLGITQLLEFVNTSGNNPVDSTTYYYPMSNAGMQTTENSQTKRYSPIAGTITKLTLTNGTQTTQGSGELLTITLRINGVDTAITGTMPWDGSTSNITTGVFTGSVALAVGDIITIKVVTPAWATNPVATKGIAAITVLMDQ